MVANLVKHICVYCKSVRYIPIKLRDMAYKMLCRVCGRDILKDDAPKYLGGVGRGNGGEHD